MSTPINIPKSAAVVLTPEEGNALLQILDIAAKAAGLSAARECVFFHDKIQNAFKQAQAALVETTGETPSK